MISNDSLTTCAAAAYLADRAEIDPDRIGLAGHSQGAWVAPLAAARHEGVAFVIVNYDMIESPAEEARLEIRQPLIGAGVEEDDLCPERARRKNNNTNQATAVASRPEADVGCCLVALAAEEAGHR